MHVLHSIYILHGGDTVPRHSVCLHIPHDRCRAVQPSETHLVAADVNVFVLEHVSDLPEQAFEQSKRLIFRWIEHVLIHRVYSYIRVTDVPRL